MTDHQSRAEQFYQEIVGHNDPAAFLCQLITQGKAEDDYLEFKGGILCGLVSEALLAGHSSSLCILGKPQVSGR